MVCWFLLQNNVNQLKVDIYSLLRSLPPLLPSHPFRLSQSTELSSQGHTAAFHEPPILHMTVYMSVLLSLYICMQRLCIYVSSPHPLLSPAFSTSLFSMSSSLFLPCTQVYQYHFSRFSLSLSLYIYIYIYSVQFSRSVVSDSLRSHGLQHARPPCPSPTPSVYSNSCPLNGDAIQPSHPLSSPSPTAFNLSQHEGLFQ